MSLQLALQSALSGLNVAQAGLQVTSNNIANVNTEGYTKKSVDQQSNALGGQGVGVKLNAVGRTVDQVLLTQIRDQAAVTGKLDVTRQFLQLVESQFGRVSDDASLAHRVGALGNAGEALANTPESSELRFSFVNEAKQLALQITNTHAQLQDSRLNADRQIESAVGELNTLLNDVANLNVQIARAIGLNQDTAELDDQRDLALKDISELVDIATFTRSSGETVIMTTSGKSLLDGPFRSLSHTAVTTMSSSISYTAGGSSTGNGTVDGIYIGTAAVTSDITGDISGGKLGGLIALRDTTLPALTAQLEEFTQEFRYAINAQHNTGTALPAPNSLTGQLTVAGTDALGTARSGTFTTSILDANGAVVGTWTSADLSTYANVNAMIADFNTALSPATATMAINTDGKLTVTATSSSNGVAINQGDTSVTAGGQTYGVSHYFGLNDVFTVSGATGTSESSTLAVRADIVNDPNLLAHGTLDATATVGEIALTAGDGSAMTQIAAAFTSTTTFDAAGGQPASSSTFETYASAIIGYTATLVSDADREYTFAVTYSETLEFRATNQSGVNIDEELSNIVLLENAYQASARVLQVASDMLEILTNLGR